MPTTKELLGPSRSRNFDGSHWLALRQCLSVPYSLADLENCVLQRPPEPFDCARNAARRAVATRLTSCPVRPG